MDERERSRAMRELIAILRLAYSGELAAAFAYRGHWKSLADAEQRRRVQEIEREEWHHRELIRGILQTLGAPPRRIREIRAWLIGKTLGALCHVSGWLLPMYGAGKLESRNVREYEAAARHAAASGHAEWVDGLLTMAEVEWEHEAYFRARVLSRRLGRLLPIWPAPPPKECIRSSFERETRRLEASALAVARNMLPVRLEAPVSSGREP